MAYILQALSRLLKMLALAYEINCTASHATCEEVLLNTAAKRLAELSALA